MRLALLPKKGLLPGNRPGYMLGAIASQRPTPMVIDRGSPKRFRLTHIWPLNTQCFLRLRCRRCITQEAKKRKSTEPILHLASHWLKNFGGAAFLSPLCNCCTSGLLLSSQLANQPFLLCFFGVVARRRFLISQSAILREVPIVFYFYQPGNPARITWVAGPSLATASGMLVQC